jgi:transcriptional regulator with XRE-family HTH domain
MAVRREGNDRPPATPSRRKPTINDVAQMAGVSFGTVSRVLNDAPDVSASTRERVLQIIKDIGYRRNRAATALVTSRSTSIGILSDGSPRFGPVGTLLALENVARKKGYATTVISVEKPYEESVQAALDSLDDSGVGGIIVIAPVVDHGGSCLECHMPRTGRDDRRRSLVDSQCLHLLRKSGAGSEAGHPAPYRPGSYGHRAYCRFHGLVRWTGPQARLGSGAAGCRAGAGALHRR